MLMDRQYSIRDLLMGEGTPYRILDSSNFFTRSARSMGSSPRAWSHGVSAGAEWLDEAVIPLRVLIDTTDMDEWQTHFNTLAYACRPIEDGQEAELRYRLSGIEYLMYVRPRSIEPDLELIAYGRSFVDLVFVATTPIRYSGELNELDITLPVYSGGLTVPFSVPFSIDGFAVGGSALAENQGTMESAPLFHITGPVVKPKIIVKRPDGQINTITIDIDIPAGYWLDIDCGKRTVVLNNTASRRGQTILSPAGIFPLLPPGTSEILYRGTNFTGSILTVTWRDTYI